MVVTVGSDKSMPPFRLTQDLIGLLFVEHSFPIVIAIGAFERLPKRDLNYIQWNDEFNDNARYSRIT
jgi:hypothetical protein